MNDRQEFTDPQRAHHRDHHVRRPTHELSHEERIKRERFHVTVLTFVLLGTLAMLGYSAAFDIDHPGEWIVLGAIVATAIGAIVAVTSR